MTDARQVTFTVFVAGLVALTDVGAEGLVAGVTAAAVDHAPVPSWVRAATRIW